MSPAEPEASLAEPRASVIVVSWNAREDLLRCLASVHAHAAVPFEATVVDNASSDGSPAAVRAAFPATRVIENDANLGFARASNQGLREARAPYVLFLNPDAELQPGALPTLLRLLDEDPRMGAVGPRTCSLDGSIQVSFGPDLSLASEWRQRRLVKGVRDREPGALATAERLAAQPRELGWVSGSCLLGRRDALDGVGGFDEGFFLYEEDADLCRRLRQAGWRVAFAPQAEVLHRLGRSMAQAPLRSRAEYHRSHLRYYRKHNGVAATLALRLLIGASATLRLALSLGTSAVARARREEARAALGIALRGR